MQNSPDGYPKAMGHASTFKATPCWVEALGRRTNITGYALPSNGEFVALLDAYRDLGGLARAREVASMTVARCAQRINALAARIVDRQLLSFEWQSQIWLPLFQFDHATMALRPGLEDIVTSLSRRLAPWEQAHWFAQPNGWLNDRVPARVLPLDHAAVVQAADADELAIAA